MYYDQLGKFFLSDTNNNSVFKDVFQIQQQFDVFVDQVLKDNSVKEILQHVNKI